MAVFPGRSNNGKSSHGDEYGHGHEKRRPSTYVEGKMYTSMDLSIKLTGFKVDSIVEWIGLLREIDQYFTDRVA